MGGHIRGGLEARSWGAGVCSDLGVPSRSGGDAGLPESFWISFRRVETLVSAIGFSPEFVGSGWGSGPEPTNRNGKLVKLFTTGAGRRQSSPYLFWWPNRTLFLSEPPG